jgi:hypothetical protein
MNMLRLTRSSGLWHKAKAKATRLGSLSCRMGKGLSGICLLHAMDVPCVCERGLALPGALFFFFSFFLLNQPMAWFTRTCSGFNAVHIAKACV